VRIPQPQCPASRCFDSLATALAGAVSSTLNQEISVVLEQTEELEYLQLRRSVQEPTCLFIFRAQPAGEPVERRCYVEFAPETACTLIDLLFRKPDGAQSTRKILSLSQVDRRLLRKAASAVMDTFEREILNPPGGRISLNNTNAKPPRGTREVHFSVAAYKMQGPNWHGMFRLAVPSYLPAGAATEKSNCPDVQEAVVSLPLVEMPVKDLANLQPGDIINTEIPAGQAVVLDVPGIGKFAARLGLIEGKRAVRILGPLDQQTDS